MTPREFLGYALTVAFGIPYVACSAVLVILVALSPRGVWIGAPLIACIVVLAWLMGLAAKIGGLKGGLT